MKTLSTLLATILIVVVAQAQTPNFINYQAVARDGSGSLMANQNINVTFLIRSGSAAGTVIFEEDHTGVTTNQFGLFSLLIGDGTPVTGTIGGIIWGANSYFLEVEVNGTSVSSQQLVSVPFALESGAPWTRSGTDIAYTQGGNVGVGTPSPGTGLHVLNSNEIARFESTGTGSYISMYNSNGYKGYLWAIGDNCEVGTPSGSTGNLVLATNVQDRLTITSTGLAGLMTSSPASDLHIKQSASPWPNPSTGGLILEHSASTDKWQIWASNPYCSYAYNGTRVAYVNNTTGAWTTTSDRKFKKNIEPLQNVLARIGKLDAVKYHYNQQADTDTKNWGFIAQNVEELFPELVQYSEDGSELGLAYAEFSVLAIKAIQELKAQVDALQLEMELLKSK